MRYSFVLMIAAAVIHFGCSQESLTGVESEPGNVEAGSRRAFGKTGVKMVPFNGEVSVYGWLNLARTDCPVGSLPLDAEGGGSASYLGRFEVYYEYCSFAQVNPANPTYVGTGIMTAANGDKLFLTYNGLATSPTSFIETNTIIGGTGRLENAIGSFELVGGFGPHPAGVAIDGSLEGEISSVGSTK